MEFTDREFQIIQDREFLITKSEITSKMQDLLVDVRSELKDTFHQSRLAQNLEEGHLSGKISKGENYRGLPYLLLDYPAYFSKEDIFAFRTMFWWGNFFSCTLHLQGEYLALYRNQLADNIVKLTTEDTYLCVNNTPWEYHYEGNNYKILALDDLDFMKVHPFLKISRRFELDNWKKLTTQANEFLGQLIDIIYLNP
jgi:hypothetical protein